MRERMAEILLQEMTLDETYLDWMKRYPKPSIYITKFQLIVDSKAEIHQRIGTIGFT